MADLPISSDPTLTDAQIAGGDLVPLVDVSEPLAADKNKNTTFTYLIAYFNTNLSFAASGHNHDSDYISVVATPTTGNFPQLTAGGELVNSAYDETSFAAASHGHTEDEITLSTTNVLVGRTTAGGGGAEEIDISALTVVDAPMTGNLIGEDTGGALKRYPLANFFTTDEIEITSVGDGEILQYSSGSATWINRTFAEAGLGGGGLTAVYKTSNYTAVAGDFIVMDANGASKTVTLPATIAAGDRIAVSFRDGTNGLASTYTCTIGRNSKTIRYGGAINGYVGGSADDITMYAGETIELIATDTSNWNIV